MERLSRLLAAHVGWPWRTAKALEEEARRRQHELEEKERRERRYRCNVVEATGRLLGMIESVLLWENTCNSLSVAVAFNILFWGFVVLEVRGFAAASSAALVIVLCYSTLETQEEVMPNFQIWQAKTEQVEKLVKKVKTTFESLIQMQQEQPRAFCTVMCTISLGLWLIGRNLDSLLLTYTLCMSILIGPAFILRFPCKELSYKEWDSEIEEFLPAATHDNLQVLKRAGETGDRSPTPPSLDMESSHDHFTDEDLFGLRMPSHEDGSTDGLELSELELSTSETDVDGIRFQTGYFERGSSSSDDDVDLGIESRKLDEDDDSDGSEFEIIDSREVASLKSV